MPIAPEDEPYTAAARPDTASGKRIGVLLVHGFTSTPASMRPWAEHLAQEGFAVSVPLLPGHATTWQDCNTKTYDDWYGEAERALEKLLSECDQVFVAGLSMGGFIALNLAVERGRDVAGLVLVNPAVNSTRKDAKLIPILKHVVQVLAGHRQRHQEARRRPSAPTPRRPCRPSPPSPDSGRACVSGSPRSPSRC